MNKTGISISTIFLINWDKISKSLIWDFSVMFCVTLKVLNWSDSFQGYSIEWSSMSTTSRSLSSLDFLLCLAGNKASFSSHLFVQADIQESLSQEVKGSTISCKNEEIHVWHICLLFCVILVKKSENDCISFRNQFGWR